MYNKFKFNYDIEFDIMYLFLSDNESSIGEEENNGIIVRRSINSGEFVGLTILDFKQKLKTRKLCCDFKS